MTSAVACTHDRHDNERNTMNEQHKAGTDAYEVKTIHDHSAANVCRRECPGYRGMIAEKTAARFKQTQTQNERGEWVPAIPTPLFVYLGVRCDCGRKFWSIPTSALHRYRGHYAYAHILGMEPAPVAPVSSATEGGDGA